MLQLTLEVNGPYCKWHFKSVAAMQYWLVIFVPGITFLQCITGQFAQIVIHQTTRWQHNILASYGGATW